MYKWDAKDYNKSSAEQQKWAREVIAKLGLKGNERILDIGCGDGKITAEIAENYMRISKNLFRWQPNKETLISVASRFIWTTGAVPLKRDATNPAISNYPAKVGLLRSMEVYSHRGESRDLCDTALEM